MYFSVVPNIIYDEKPIKYPFSDADRVIAKNFFRRYKLNDDVFSYAVFQGGAPVATELKISFMETKLVFAEDIDMGEDTPLDLSVTAPSGQQYGPMASDVRLKENITKVGNSPSGINIYEWNYIGNKQRYRGVMAQEILEKHPEAVALQPDGYMSVYYGKIDVNMERVK